MRWTEVEACNPTGRGVERVTPLEWVDVEPGVVVIATETGAKLHSLPSFGPDPFALPMTGEGQQTTTHFLLEGAVVLAGRLFHERRAAALADATSARGAPLSPLGWAYRLAGYFHTTHATRRLLPGVAARFARAGRKALADWAEHSLREEVGHDNLALVDLKALGYRDPRAWVDAVRPARAMAWVALFEQLAAEPDPVGCVGYAHALERLALLSGEAEIGRIESALPAGVNATRCLRVHSAIGSDQAHVVGNVSLTSGLSASERRAIVKACYAAARIYFDPALDVIWHLAEREVAAVAHLGSAIGAERLSPNNQGETHG